MAEMRRKIKKGRRCVCVCDVCVYAWHVLVHVIVHVIVIPWELYLLHSFPHIWFFLGRGEEERRRAVDRWLGRVEQLEKKQFSLVKKEGRKGREEGTKRAAGKIKEVGEEKKERERERGKTRTQPKKVKIQQPLRITQMDQSNGWVDAQIHACMHYYPLQHMAS